MIHHCYTAQPKSFYHQCHHQQKLHLNSSDRAPLNFYVRLQSQVYEVQREEEHYWVQTLKNALQEGSSALRRWVGGQV